MINNSAERNYWEALSGQLITCIVHFFLAQTNVKSN